MVGAMPFRFQMTVWKNDNQNSNIWKDDFWNLNAWKDDINI